MMISLSRCLKGKRKDNYDLTRRILFYSGKQYVKKSCKHSNLSLTCLLGNIGVTFKKIRYLWLCCIDFDYLESKQCDRSTFLIIVEVP